MVLRCRNIVFAILFLFQVKIAFSQNSCNSGYDRVSPVLQTTFSPKAPFSSPITISNWDNFNLGRDDAENTITEKPSVPSWYFTAFNNNSPHQSENGLDWHENNAIFDIYTWGNPCAAYDSLGNLFYQVLFGTQTQVLGAKVIRSADNGTNWSPSVLSVTGNDKPWIACDQTSGPYANYIYSTISNGNNGAFARSTDHGATFHTLFEPLAQDLPGMMVCVGPHGNIQGGAVYIVTNSGDPFASLFTFYRSLNGGTSFDLMSTKQFANFVGTNVQGKNSVEGMRTWSYPLISADNSYGPHRGRLYLVYASNDPPGDEHMPDIFFRFSDDEGYTWSDAKKINDDPNTTHNHQFHPSSWCDKETGRLYIQWMDTRDVPTHDSALIYATYSDNGGASFAPNKPVSNKKMKINCTTCGGTGIPRYQGDYNGIVSNRKVAMLGWTDFRNGSFMSTAAYFPDFALKLNKTQDTLMLPNSTSRLKVIIPDVKLFSDTVLVSGEMLVPPPSGAITFSFPQGNMMTAFPDSLPVDVVLEGNVPVGSYQTEIYATGINGTPVHKREVVLNIITPNVLTVLATATPDIICQGTSSQLQAVVYSGKPPFSYSWTPVNGLSNPAVSNPVASPLSSLRYHVLVTDSTGNTSRDSVMIQVRTALPEPGPIIGPSGVCKHDTSSYAITEIPEAISYSWTVPGDSYIVNGQNTRHIEVHWGISGGNVSVIVGSVCGNSNPSVLPVTLFDNPSGTGFISGPDTVCKQENVNFSVISLPGVVSYNWTVPGDASIVSGQGTEKIEVKWGSIPGVVSVSAQNPCGSSNPATKTVAVDSLPGGAGNIAGNDTVCVNHGNYLYSMDSIPDVSSCHWSLPPGAEITSVPDRFSVILNFTPDALTGTLSVYGVNSCGHGKESQKEITVMPCAGVDNLHLSSFRIYPNPANGTINLVTSRALSGLTITLTDIGGKVLLRKDYGKILANSVQNIVIKGFSSGIYFLKMESPEAFSVLKIVLQ
ncbi:MAG: T9SS type A sorting domain-containing protein [Bacteroidota bacterium]|nr:T9SS type A sorting domain-containing protein [Bacteroidota bacterium]